MILQSISQALQQLSQDNDNHWTADGLPRIETLKFLTGDSTITRESINEIAPGFTRASVLSATILPPVTETVVTDALTSNEVSEIAAKSDEVSLDEILEIEQQLLEDLTNDKLKLDQLIKEKTKLITDLSDAVAKQNGIVTSQDAIRMYLANQQEVLVERAERMKMIKNSGLNLKELASSLKSPLDTAITRRHKQR
jgi:hypothetical protein